MLRLTLIRQLGNLPRLGGIFGNPASHVERPFLARCKKIVVRASCNRRDFDANFGTRPIAAIPRLRRMLALLPTSVVLPTSEPLRPNLLALLWTSEQSF